MSFVDQLRLWNYDIRVRLHPVVSHIRTADPSGRWAILDVGSGDMGIAALMPGHRVVGLDRDFARRPIGPFVRASALDLPFEDQSWDVVTCIDVIEHLSEAQRTKALSEIVRVSRRMVIIAFPFGEGARKADSEMAAAYEASGVAPPDWLDEHLRQPHPEVSSTEDVLGRSAGARTESIERSYNESLRLQRAHRLLARRSVRGYQISSVLCGLAAGWLARPIAATAAYRCTVALTLKARDSEARSTDAIGARSTWQDKRSTTRCP